ncbi:MAG TPA: cupin domain-containing protein [Polyangiaceae bacterium]|nr:cupin domain-containing protein [Polyangiaceae bacterium]
MSRPGPPALPTFALLASLACQGPAPPAPAPAPPAATSEPAPAPAPASAAASGDAPAAAPPSAPALPAELPTDLDVARLEPLATCSKRACALPRPPPRGAQPEPSSPAAIWRQRLEGREAKLTVPASREGSLFGLVLAGRVSARAGNDAPAALEAWDAFHSDRGGLTLACDGDEATLLLVQIARPASPAANAPRTGPAFEVQRLREQGDLVWGRGAFRARPAFEGPARAASFGLLRGAPSAPVALHKHEGSWEILIALRAEGTFRLDTGSGQGTPRPLQDGRALAIPPEAPHAWEPAGTRPLIGVQLYVPPGPEQRFHKLADDEAAKGSPRPPEPTK